MPRHAERRLLHHTPEQLFDLVADVESYPDFLPWCLDTRLKNKREDGFLAEMVIGFKMFRERYVSRVDLDRPNRIDVSHFRGPFKHLRNHWIFEPAEGGCMIDFSVDFEFRSMLMDRLIGGVFHEAVRIMVTSFEKQADKRYAPQPDPARLLSGD
ncbi:MAG: type II toxin-antitoxin system RatA family toxin [Alphaproteobacteria bacterium]|nr:type II toxin-antitoxin system RatA family toxin [Alphaproteobacteria bacterium]